ncbi:hypothetical protein GBA52_006476 [Prunus armeniaca]|nr:hypothetical protein GBA52_006476 [Prunus armeniaca]
MAILVCSAASPVCFCDQVRVQPWAQSYLGGGAHQFQPVAGRGSTHYGSNVEQASQAESDTSTSGTSRSAIELSDIDEWLSVGPRRDGSSNTRAPPASAQEQAATAGTDNFPWTLRL